MTGREKGESEREAEGGRVKHQREGEKEENHQRRKKIKACGENYEMHLLAIIN